MSKGDPNYVYVSGGCTVTNAAGGAGFFGSFSGLSLLNAEEAVLIMVSASGGDFRLSLDPNTAATNDTSLRMFASASTFDLPPMTVANASRITFAREGANNPVAFWTILRRVP